MTGGDPSSPSADLGYRAQRIAIQYDGGHHLVEAQIFRDRRRDRAFEAAGWTVLTVKKDDLDEGFHGAVIRIKRARRMAQPDHPHASGFAGPW